MAITAYVGLPGAGKSYEVVNGPILKAAAKGRVVWTNIPVLLPGVRVVEGPELDGHWYLKAPPGALVVIDECWRYWAAGTKADAIPEEQKEWFAMHRHRTGDEMSTDIVLVTQDLSQIASFVRGLVEKTYKMRKLIELGTRNRYRVDVYNGAVTGQKPPKAQHMSGWITKYDPDGFKRYKSHTQGGEGKEVDADKRGSMLRRPTILLIPLVPLAVIFLPWVFSLVFGGDDPKPEPVLERSERQAPAPVIAPHAQPAPVEPPAPPKAPAIAPTVEASGKWTLMGVIVKEDGEGIALVQTVTGRRRVSVKENCQRSEVGEWTCKVDGQTVAMWTGNGVLQMAQGATYSRVASQ